VNANWFARPVDTRPTEVRVRVGGSVTSRACVRVWIGERMPTVTRAFKRLSGNSKQRRIMARKVIAEVRSVFPMAQVRVGERVIPALGAGHVPVEPWTTEQPAKITPMMRWWCHYLLRPEAVYYRVPSLRGLAVVAGSPGFPRLSKSMVWELSKAMLVEFKFNKELSRDELVLLPWWQRVLDGEVV
jgi:hypothetical protein